MTRSEKAAVIEAIKANADRASFAVLTEFKGMTVEELTNLRVNLRKAGGEFYVVKNTLARIAFTGGYWGGWWDYWSYGSRLTGKSYHGQRDP